MIIQSLPILAAKSLKTCYIMEITRLKVKKRALSATSRHLLECHQHILPARVDIKIDALSRATVVASMTAGAGRFGAWSGVVGSELGRRNLLESGIHPATALTILHPFTGSVLSVTSFTFAITSVSRAKIGVLPQSRLETHFKGSWDCPGNMWIYGVSPGFKA